mgnify:CR=1 FL=1
MMAGSAHACAVSSGTKAWPGSPNRHSRRSITKAARARYPVSSSRLIRKKSRQICGRNTTVPATPPMMPSATRSCTGPGGIRSPTQPPSRAKVASIRSIGTVASVNSVQKRRPITARKTATPTTGCVKAASSRSVSVSAPEPTAPGPPTVSVTRRSAHEVRETMSVPGGGISAAAGASPGCQPA